jgi:hypothetical protein
MHKFQFVSIILLEKKRKLKFPLFISNVMQFLSFYFVHGANKLKVNEYIMSIWNINNVKYFSKWMIFLFHLCNLIFCKDKWANLCALVYWIIVHLSCASHIINTLWWCPLEFYFQTFGLVFPQIKTKYWQIKFKWIYVMFII